MLDLTNSAMAGQRRLDSFSALVATAVEDGVPGHIIETGVWRGGSSFMAAKTLELMGETAAGRCALDSMELGWMWFMRWDGIECDGVGMAHRLWHRGLEGLVWFVSVRLSGLTWTICVAF